MPGLAQSAPARQNSAEPWWSHAVFYEIYPRSFKDTNGDGTGDINGITEKLDYLQKLGIDAIWIAPCYPSPQVDFGYDISDYEAIDPKYGTLADFDRLVAEAKKRNIRIVMDMVLNHTSDKHAWFVESASSRTNAKADWFVWNDGKIGPDGKHMPPNNWTSSFGGSAWEWVPARQQYYYHKFYVQQPDLNWRNPAVEKAMFDQMRFWLDRGVAGFRLDAIGTLFEDPSLADEAVRKDDKDQPMKDNNGEPMLMHDKTGNLPEVHDVLRRLRAMMDGYPGDRVLIGETNPPNIAELEKWYGGTAKNELQLPMDMGVEMEKTLDAATWRAKLNEAETQLHGSMPLLVIDNHDQPRYDRYCAPDRGAAPGADCRQIEKMISTMLFMSRDAALFYYGDEIGMKTTPPTRVEDVQDPVGRRYWPKRKGRDGERTPMQWSDGKDAGFSTAATTWLPIPPDYTTVNVATEMPDDHSMFAWYSTLIATRKGNPAIQHGEFQMEDVGNDKIVAFTRSYQGEKVLVLLNFSGVQETFHTPQFSGRNLRKLAANYDVPASMAVAATQTLPAYGALVAEVK